MGETLCEAAVSTVGNKHVILVLISFRIHSQCLQGDKETISMGIMTIFSDESGFTGPNLTNKDQPYFVLATISSEEHDAKAIRDYFFSSVRAQELKHGSLARNVKRHSMVLEYLKYLQSCQHLFKMYVVDKEFATVVKVVDYLVETAAHKMGLDIYSDGSAFKFANTLYHLLVAYETSSYRIEFLSRFEGMMRYGARIRYDEFFDYVERPVASGELGRALNVVRATRHVLVADQVLLAGPDALDVSFTTALNLMAEWRKETDQDFYLIHDMSSPMVKETRLWEALTDMSVEPKTIGYGPKTMRFPIGVAKTSFEDSKSWVGLQLADVLAGSVARSLTARKRRETDPYVSLISETALNLPALTILPGGSADWPGTPDDGKNMPAGRSKSVPLGALFSDCVRANC